MKNETINEGWEQSGVERRQMAPGETMSLAGHEPLLNREQMLELKGINVATLAGIKAGDKTFMILDLRETPADGPNGTKMIMPGDNSSYLADYMIVDETFRQEAGKGLKGIRIGEGPVEIGRSHHADRFAYSNKVSREHFAVVADEDGLRIINHNPTNPTEIIYGPEKSGWDGMGDVKFDKKVELSWNEHLDDSKHYWPPEMLEVFGEE
ncbi:hypothetical protein FWF89_01470 [Candidatus Saccharibacteria bacterium]|nr:hypothetical protein [Candidatus Saccharibacteria bacterium]